MDSKSIALEGKKYGINSNVEFALVNKEDEVEFSEEEIKKYVNNVTHEQLIELSKDRKLAVETLKHWKVGWDGYAYTVPVRDENEKCRNFFRKEIGKDTISKKGGEGILFGIRNLVDNNPEIIVVEGCWSAMSLWERGFSAVGLAGAGQLKDYQIPLFKDKEVILVPDVDKSGFAGIQKVANKLKDVAKSIKIVNLTGKVKDKEDIKDFFNSGGTKEHFEELIQQAEIAETVDIVSIVKIENPSTGELVSNKKLFSIDHLPDGFLKDYVFFAEPLTEAPLQYHIATALAMVSTVLGRNVYMDEGATTYYPNLYILVIGESGITRKSTATGLAYKFLPKLNPEYILGSTMSSEALLDGFRRSYCHIILYDEIKQLIINEEKSYGKGLIALFTSLWANPPTYRVDTKNIKIEERIIENPTLNILAASTPDWLQLKEVDVLGGFLGRFLPICSSKVTKRLAIRPQMDNDVLDSLLKKLKNIQGLSGRYDWQDEAQKVFKGLYDELCDDFQKEPNRALIQPYWSRIDTHLRKLAIIFDACSFDPTYKITKDNLIRAWGIMDLITGYYREMLGTITYSFMGKKEKQLLDMVQQAGLNGIEHSDALRNLSDANAEIMKKLVTTLSEKDLIMVGVDRSGRKPKKVYYTKEVGKVKGIVEEGFERKRSEPL